jgi:restriction endonuclease Mrr
MAGNVTVSELVIRPQNDAPENKKGDLFEEILQRIMRGQRYRVVKRVNFTGTEIDLLCEHMDRPRETALVECKAKRQLSSNDLKMFAYDVLVEERATIGFFVHTSELQHQAAGVVETWRQDNKDSCHLAYLLRRPF